jgi:hypothetical protein
VRGVEYRRLAGCPAEFCTPQAIVDAAGVLEKLPNGDRLTAVSVALHEIR